MTDTTREAVARAICFEDGMSWEGCVPLARKKYLRLADAALAALRPAQDAEGWVYKTYRVEWVAQTGHVDQYGREFKPDYERAFPTRDEALEHMKTLATYDERLMRWVTGKSYHQGEVSYREALAATAPRSGESK